MNPYAPDAAGARRAAFLARPLNLVGARRRRAPTGQSPLARERERVFRAQSCTVPPCPNRAKPAGASESGLLMTINRLLGYTWLP